MNVSSPRIYVDLLGYFQARGLFKGIEGDYTFDKPSSLIGLNPSNITTIDNSNVTSGSTIDIVLKDNNKFINFISNSGNIFSAVLGHNFASAQASYYCMAESTDFQLATDPLINFPDAVKNPPEYDGFTITSGTDGAEVTNGERIIFKLEHRSHSGTGGGLGDNSWDIPPYIGSLAFGSYWDAFHSPDLSLTQTYEMDGVTTQQTKGGATLSNMRYSGNPKWGTVEATTGTYELGAWELAKPLFTGEDVTGYEGVTPSTIGRPSRRIWHLTFSYLSDKQVLPINALGTDYFDIESASLYDSSEYTSDDSSDTFNSNVLTGTDFFSQVWSKTLGGHLPFIFNPQGGGDSPDNNPSNFAICRFDQDSLKVTQTSPSLYSISLKIRECW